MTLLQTMQTNDSGTDQLIRNSEGDGFEVTHRKLRFAEHLQKTFKTKGGDDFIKWEIKKRTRLAIKPTTPKEIN